MKAYPPLSIRPCSPPDRPGVYLFAGRAQAWYTRDRLSLVRVSVTREGGLICLDDTDVMTPDEWGEGVWHEIVGAGELLAQVRGKRATLENAARDAHQLAKDQACPAHEWLPYEEGEMCRGCGAERG